MRTRYKDMARNQSSGTYLTKIIQKIDGWEIENLHTKSDDPEDIKTCLNCPLDVCRNGSVKCPLNIKRYNAKKGKE